MFWCRKTLQHFAEYGHKQHEALLQRQEQIEGLHDRLLSNSKSMLAAQVLNLLTVDPFIYYYF